MEAPFSCRGACAVYPPNIVQECDSIVASLVLIAILVTALAAMVGFVKPADCVKHCGAILGAAIVLVLIVSVFVSMWSSMSLWQKAVVALIAFGCGVLDGNGVSHEKSEKRNRASWANQSGGEHE